MDIIDFAGIGPHLSDMVQPKTAAESSARGFEWADYWRDRANQLSLENAKLRQQIRVLEGK